MAKLHGVKLERADLSREDLRGQDLRATDLRGARLGETILSGADLSGADVRRAVLVGTNLKKATLRDSSVYGVAAWDVRLDGSNQSSLIITSNGEPGITVDGLEVAQFIYLLLKNEKIRSIIDTVTSKVVLILGRFTPERKAVLDAIREEVRGLNYVPVLFD